MAAVMTPTSAFLYFNGHDVINDDHWIHSLLHKDRLLWM